MEQRNTFLGIPIEPWRNFEGIISFYDTESLAFAMDARKKFILTSLEAKQGMVVMRGMVFRNGKYEDRTLNFDKDQVKDLNKWMAKSGFLSKRIKF